MEESVSCLETSYPAKKIGNIIFEFLGNIKYEIIKNILQKRGNRYMLDVLCDSMFISGTKFFSSLYNGSLYDVLYEIETTTPSIYYILYTRLNEATISGAFDNDKKNIISSNCFNQEQINQLMLCTNEAEWLTLTKKFISQKQYQSVSNSKQERICTWNYYDSQLKRELSMTYV